MGDSSGNNVTPVNSISNSGTLVFRNAAPQTISAGIINGTAGSLLDAFGTSVLEIDGTNSVGQFTPSGGTVNIGSPSIFNNTNFTAIGKTIIGQNGGAPHAATVVNWNAYGGFALVNGAPNGNFVGIADANGQATPQTATFNMNGGSLGISNANVFIGNGNGELGSSNGTFNMDGGTVTVNNSNAFEIGGLSAFSLQQRRRPERHRRISLHRPGQRPDTIGAVFAVSMAWAPAGDSATINLTGGTLSTARGFLAGG